MGEAHYLFLFQACAGLFCCGQPLVSFDLERTAHVGHGKRQIETVLLVLLRLRVAIQHTDGVLSLKMSRNMESIGDLAVGGLLKSCPSLCAACGEITDREATRLGWRREQHELRWWQSFEFWAKDNRVVHRIVSPDG